MDIKYPEIKIKLIGKDGNAFAILGRCYQAMRKNECTKEQIEEFQKEAASGDYDHLLQTCIKYFTVK